LPPKKLPPTKTTGKIPRDNRSTLEGESVDIFLQLGVAMFDNQSQFVGMGAFTRSSLTLVFDEVLYCPTVCALRAMPPTGEDSSLGHTDGPHAG
jgi:hypothetical protein